MKRKAVTFLEVIIVIVLVGIFSVGIASFLWYVTENVRLALFRQELTLQTSRALDWVVREIREIDLQGSNLDISYAGDSRLVFINVEGEEITFQLTATILERSVDSGNAYPLCEDVSSFLITYQDENNNILQPSPGESLSQNEINHIHHMIIDISVQKSGEWFRLSSWVVPRNLIIS